MNRYFTEIPLNEGFEIAKKALDNSERALIAGREVSLCSGIELFLSLEGTKISCYKCGITADRWVSVLGRNDHKNKPVLNLYGVNRKGGCVMMTRDHIIPKHFGGIDSVKNLRPACEFCNSIRGHDMEEADVRFMMKNPELISEYRRIKGFEAKLRMLAEEKEHKRLAEERKKLKKEKHESGRSKSIKQK